MPSILIYEENRAYVIEKFHHGHFDYIDVVQEVAQRDFFRYMATTQLLEQLAASYPWPREKEEVPCWFYLAADMAMRLHGNHAFHGFPWIVSRGDSVGFRAEGGGVKRIECQGFNAKNS